MAIRLVVLLRTRVGLSISNYLHKIFILVSFTIVGSLSGCASGGAHNSKGEQLVDVRSAFSRGEIRLTCGVTCSGKWGLVSARVRKLHDEQAWSDLASAVANVGMAVDQSYYYLGRAAEGQGYFESARTYYYLALSEDYKCAEWINNCNGFEFPRDIHARLSKLPPQNSNAVK